MMPVPRRCQFGATNSATRLARLAAALGGRGRTPGQPGSRLTANTTVNAHSVAGFVQQHVIHKQLSLPLAQQKMYLVGASALRRLPEVHCRLGPFTLLAGL